MNTYTRRHSRWFEKLILSRWLHALLGATLITYITLVIRWDLSSFQSLNTVQSNSVIAVIVTYAACLIILNQILNYPGARTLLYILSTVTVFFLLTNVFFLFTRFSYSRLAILDGYFFTLLWCLAGYFLGKRVRVDKVAVLPQVCIPDEIVSNHYDLRVLDEADLGKTRFDAVVADFNAENLTPEWEKFLANCALSDIPVIDVHQFIESLSGRVPLDHLSPNTLGTLLPSPTYRFVKRGIDLLVVFILLPLLLPIMLITAVIIKLESVGPALFIQERVGRGNRNFKIYKFRSMCKNSEADGAQFASSGDMRVTRVGKFIRKTRIDELPQLFNVLLGDMSLIGPRPEQRVFVDEFEQKIPFYSYRHVVRPGITGWAQVRQGYAAGEDETRIKLEHDLYYIKNFSFWLDFLIVLKTIRTILTGFGAR